MNGGAFFDAVLAKGAVSVTFTGASTASTDAGAGLCLFGRRAGSA